MAFMNKEWNWGLSMPSLTATRVLVAVAAVCLPAVAITQSTKVPAGTAAQAAAQQDIAGSWQASIRFPGAQRDTRMVVKVTKTVQGYNAALLNADQPTSPLTFTSVTWQGTDVKISGSIMTVEGKLSSDGNVIDGTLSLGPNPIQVSFARATPSTEWAIPEPPKAMAATADPNFDVATIKASDPGSRQGKGFGMRGTHFTTYHTNLNDLIAFAYGLHSKQIIGAPDWFGTDLFDIDGVPDTPGQPNMKQMGILLQKLLADRCGLKFHRETRELSVYVITVAAGGPKMTMTTAAASDPEGFGFRGLGDLMVRNMTMRDFADGMQSAVTDKPVVDHTGLMDRYDFTLKWTPDDSQFAQFRTAVSVASPKTDDPNAPPSLYTAIEEQAGLKIEATKAQDDVIVIDHVEKPSAN